MRQMAGAPPRPRLAYRVGVTGHRTLSPAVRGEVKAGVALLLEHVRDTVLDIRARHAAVYSSEPATLVMVSPLARGADRLVARRAAELGFELDVPTPYDLVDTDPGIADSDTPAGTLYRSARARFILDGLRGDVQSYVEVGRRVVWNSDLLIAIWDGRAAAGPGGTAEIVRLAREHDIPVVHFHTQRPGSITLHAGPDPIEAPTVEELLSRITRLLEQTLVPPGPEVPGGHQASNLLRTYFKEKPAGALTRRFIGKAYAFLTGLVVLPARMAFTPLPKNCVAASRKAWREDWSRAGVPSWLTNQIEDRLLAHYAWANDLSIRYAIRYRSAFFWIYGLATLAVAAAVAGHVGDVHVGEARAEWHTAQCTTAEKASTPECNELGRRLKALKRAAAPWGVYEFLFLLVVLGLFVSGRWGKYHEKWVDYRSLAERIRHLTFLLPLGSTSPAIRVPVAAQHADPSSTWVNWLFRAVVRQAGLFDARLNGEYLAHCRALLVDDVVRGQAAYHERVARRLGTLHRRLHGVTIFLFVSALVVSLLHLLHVEWSRPLEDAPFVLAVLLPAVGAALHGFMSQGDFENVSLRAESAHRQLSRLADEVASLYLATPAQRREMASAVRRDRLAALDGESLREDATRAVNDRLDPEVEPALAIAVPDLDDRRREWLDTVARASDEELRALLARAPVREFPPAASAELGRYARHAADIMGDELIGWRADSQVRPLVLA